MTILKHEFRQSRKALLLWALIIGALLSVSILLFPEMKGEMAKAGDMFADMGSFTAAFGMDKLNFAEYDGYYAVECANVLGLGGAFFAAFCAVGALSGEEKNRTAEFLLTHPVKRTDVLTQKLLSILLRLIAFNLAVFSLSLLSTALVGEKIPWKVFLLMHAAFFLMQTEIAGICFGISAFMSRESLGIGLGLAMLLYFINIVSNLAEPAKFLKYLTPFGYCEGSSIVNDGALDGVKILIGFALGAAGIAAAYYRYLRKDIRA